MEPRQYLALIRRWAWLLALGLVIGVLGGFLVSTLMTPVYRASTKVLITQSGSNSLIELMGSSQSLADTYTELLLTRPVLQATSERLGYPVTRDQVIVQRVQNAEIVQLSVEDNDPQRAADIANTLVTVFLEQNSSMQANRYAESEKSLKSQIDTVSAQITTLETELNNLSEQGFASQQEAVTAIIANLQNEITTLNDDITRLTFDYPSMEVRDAFTGRVAVVTATPSVEQRSELAAKATRLDELQSLLGMYQQIYVNLSVAGDNTQSQSRRTDQIQAALNLYQQIYSNLVSNYESIRLSRFQNAPNVLQVEQANPPRNPVRPSIPLNMALGGALGLLLAVGGITVKETMNSTLRTPEEVMEALQTPVLGYISQMENGYKKEDARVPYVLLHPRSPVTEAFRSLRTNLQFAELDRPLRTLLISSQGTSEGKTTIAVNLAVVISQTGKNVVLIDADLRRPRVHSELALPNRVGLSNVLRERAPVSKVIQRYKNEHLMVMTSGGLPPNPAEVLSSQRMVEVLQELTTIADLVILDGPPLVFAESIALSAEVDGVLMVVRPNQTEAQPAVTVMEQLHRVGARVVGVVLNRVKEESSPYYGHYKTYSHYAVRGDDSAPPEPEETQPVRVNGK